MPVIKFITWIARKVMEEAERELYDPEKIRHELVTLSDQLEVGDITEEEYNKSEAELLERLERAEAEE